MRVNRALFRNFSIFIIIARTIHQHEDVTNELAHTYTLHCLRFCLGEDAGSNLARIIVGIVTRLKKRTLFGKQELFVCVVPKLFAEPLIFIRVTTC